LLILVVRVVSRTHELPSLAAGTDFWDTPQRRVAETHALAHSLCHALPPTAGDPQMSPQTFRVSSRK